MRELKWVSFLILMAGAVGNLVAAIMGLYAPHFTTFIFLGVLGWAIHAALKEVIDEYRKGKNGQ